MVAAVAATALFTCRPAQGLGTLTYVRARVVHVVDLATCRDRSFGRPTVQANPLATTSPNGVFRASLDHNTIVVTNLRRHRSFDLFRGPRAVELLGWSPDSSWVLFAIDPMGSASIAADGLRLQVVAAAAGPVVTIASGLLYDDYRSWCGGRLVMTAGGDRIATTNKRLVVTRPGTWRVRTLVDAPDRAFGSIACGADGKSIVVQSQPASTDANFFHTKWSLWRVAFKGAMSRLTSPPAGFADESPLPSGKTVFFVRSHKGVGAVYAVRDGKVLGPFASLGYALGYYGHHTWDYSVTP
jgi:hypothetical protein